MYSPFASAAPGDAFARANLVRLRLRRAPDRPEHGVVLQAGGRSARRVILGWLNGGVLLALQASRIDRLGAALQLAPARTHGAREAMRRQLEGAIRALELPRAAGVFAGATDAARVAWVGVGDSVGGALNGVGDALRVADALERVDRAAEHAASSLKGAASASLKEVDHAIVSLGAAAPQLARRLTAPAPRPSARAARRAQARQGRPRRDRHASRRRATSRTLGARA
ncbi:hypothetical protein KFE25_009490 [Diacronema lutheri]|mgnify:CR=1 FL=1|uniref:Uncharacterized protein n=1 Tax=Diacronema lutheri TaxID=2081491 RepID=A0A8J6CFU4_DIALT|nr:hypothetical protein KFE25_009490 [Diacronema lutheri]